ncbi:hydroxyphenylacetyl-CoA thioesterase PaaI [Asinibacterium sp. OR53]|uniref:hydroxyphenylacetyl-CoA thioesterase PaaI n=1 Tax=Asinibacterium sp. OR53 TaxID=925409 RepID=UPI000479C545|nr:hydroxyphenylacetyl-CoA thioesterase PaaI [Asinibacterium sp. OR53]
MNEKDVLARQAVDYMMQKDYFSQWMGVTVLAVKEGYSKIQMTLRKEMMNGFGIAHGGVTFALADSAFAFACNSDAKVTVALDVSISFPKPGLEGDILTAEAKKINQTNRTGLYLIEVANQRNELVALFKGTCYKTEKDLIKP